MTDEGLRYLTALTSLKRANFSHLKGITDKGLASLRFLPALEDLSLVGCEGIQGTGLAYLQVGCKPLPACTSFTLPLHHA